MDAPSRAAAGRANRLAVYQYDDRVGVRALKDAGGHPTAVLSLWGAAVAQRMGFKLDEALSLGRAPAGLRAQSKGRRLRIYKPSDKKDMREKRHGEDLNVGLLGRSIPAQNTPDGIRTAYKERVVTSESVERYLNGKFGDDQDWARSATKKLARAGAPKELEKSGFKL